MSGHPLFSTDSGEKAEFLKLFIRTAIPGLPVLAMGQAYGMLLGWYGGGIFVLLLLLDLPLIFVLSTVLWLAMQGTAQGFAHTVLGAGNLKPDPAHSGCESLVARGFYPEAAASFRALIVEHPKDDLARIKLAQVYRDHLGEPETAESLLLEVRRHGTDPRHEVLAANLLIELYRATGRKDRLMVELARFADRYKGSRAAAEAARTLREMKEELGAE
jgi:hypothetical protein